MPSVGHGCGPAAASAKVPDIARLASGIVVNVVIGIKFLQRYVPKQMARMQTHVLRTRDDSLAGSA